MRSLKLKKTSRFLDRSEATFLVATNSIIIVLIEVNAIVWKIVKLTKFHLQFVTLAFTFLIRWIQTFSENFYPNRFLSKSSISNFFKYFILEFNQNLQLCSWIEERNFGVKTGGTESSGESKSGAQSSSPSHDAARFVRIILSSNPLSPLWKFR